MDLHCMRFEDDESGFRYCEFVPIVRDHVYKRNRKVMTALRESGSSYRFCLGKVWATPMHGPFNNMEKNVVGPGNDSEDDDGRYNFNRGNPLNPSLIYKNIEVELAPSFLCHQ